MRKEEIFQYGWSRKLGVQENATGIGLGLHEAIQNVADLTHFKKYARPTRLDSKNEERNLTRTTSLD